MRLPDPPWLNVTIEDILPFASLDAVEFDEPVAATNADLVRLWRTIASLPPFVTRLGSTA